VKNSRRSVDPVARLDGEHDRHLSLAARTAAEAPRNTRVFSASGSGGSAAVRATPRMPQEIVDGAVGRPARPSRGWLDLVLGRRAGPSLHARTARASSIIGP